MCGRFVAATGADDLVRFLMIDERKDVDLPASYNVAPTDPVRAAVEHRGHRLLVTFRWGLVPRWAADSRSAARMINARSETAADKPAFREAYRRRRCLVPADGFYEWTRPDGGAPTPHFIHPTGGPLFAFAGLWETWRDPAAPDRPPLRTCAILTTVADKAIAGLHERMPVVLPPELWDPWLDRGLRDADVLRGLVAEAPPAALAYHRVSAAVNSVANNDAGLPIPCDG